MRGTLKRFVRVGGVVALSKLIRWSWVSGHFMMRAERRMRMKEVLPVMRRAARKPSLEMRRRRVGAQATPPMPVPARMIPIASPRRAVNQVGVTVTAGM